LFTIKTDNGILTQAGKRYKTYLFPA